jgi:hypothetical protein
VRAYRYLIGIALAVGVGCALRPAPAAAVPVFARLYDKPCGTCHTVFPQLNPEGENFRAHGFHGLSPAVPALEVGSVVDVPGTLPLAVYFAAGEDLSAVDVSGRHDPTRTHFNLDFLSLLAGGELGRHLAFLLDYRFVETEPDTGKIETYSVPYQAYITAHAEPWAWLANVKGGWYELPLGVSPEIHRLSARPYLIYGANACTLLGVEPPHGTCEDEPTLAASQIGLDVSAVQPGGGLRWAVGFTNGSDNHLNGGASKDFYLHAAEGFGAYRPGLFIFYSPDIVGNGVNDHTLRFGPNLDVYSRRVRVLGQFLAGYESNPTGHDVATWYYGGFLEGDYRLTTTLVSLLRVDYAWTPRFDDTTGGGDTDVRRRLWEITAGTQWLILQNLKLVAEVTYGEGHDGVSDQTTTMWAGTVRVVTAFWALTPPGVPEWLERTSTP